MRSSHHVLLCSWGALALLAACGSAGHSESSTGEVTSAVTSTSCTSREVPVAAEALGWDGASTYADLDHDGHLDLLRLAGKGDAASTAHDLTVALGRGDGSFGAARYYQMPGAFQNAMAVTHGVIAADVDEDGKLDVLTEFDKGLWLSRGNGDGTLRTGVEIGMPGRAVHPDVDGNHPMAVADLDRDGHLDLALARADGLWLRRGDGHGDFAAATPLPGLPAADMVVVADFNGDGLADIAGGLNPSNPGAGGGGNGCGPWVDCTEPPRPCCCSNSCGGGGGATILQGIQVLFGKGDGTFTEGPFLGGWLPMAMEAADLDANGTADLVVTSDDGTGSTGKVVLVTLPSGAYRMLSFSAYPTAADVNQDGKVDLVWAEPGAVRVKFGTGKLAFGPPSTFAVMGSYVFGVPSIGDFDGDLRPDALVTAYGTDTVLLNTGCR